MQVSSRLILRLSRLKFAFLAVRSVGCGSRLEQWAGRATAGDRLLTSSHVLATGEDQLVLTSSRLILRLFRLTLHPCRDSSGLRRPGARREPE